jgi:hypothetical protein
MQICHLHFLRPGVRFRVLPVMRQIQFHSLTKLEAKLFCRMCVISAFVRQLAGRVAEGPQQASPKFTLLLISFMTILAICISCCRFRVFYKFDVIC